MPSVGLPLQVQLRVSEAASSKSLGSLAQLHVFMEGQTANFEQLLSFNGKYTHNIDKVANQLRPCCRETGQQKAVLDLLKLPESLFDRSLPRQRVTNMLCLIETFSIQLAPSPSQKDQVSGSDGPFAGYLWVY